MEMTDVRGPEFKTYGRVMEGYGVSGLMKAMESTPLPGGVVYVASVPELETLSTIGGLIGGIYGRMKIQVGYCNGYSRKLNALEYHRDSGVNLAMKDLVLPLGKQQDISKDFTYDTSKVKTFLVPAGTLIKVYATTLHHTPREAGDERFRCVIVLPQGTNMELDHRPVGQYGEEKLLAARNKWLIDHGEGSLDEGAWIGLIGENISLSWSHKKKMEDTYYD